MTRESVQFASIEVRWKVFWMGYVLSAVRITEKLGETHMTLSMDVRMRQWVFSVGQRAEFRVAHEAAPRNTLWL